MSFLKRIEEKNTCAGPSFPEVCTHKKRYACRHAIEIDKTLWTDPLWYERDLLICFSNDPNIMPWLWSGPCKEYFRLLGQVRQAESLDLRNEFSR